MITFYDLENHCLYNPEGHINKGMYHFTNWFDGQQSVNMIHYQRIVEYLGVSSNPITLSFPQDGKFFFIDLSSNPNYVNIDNRDFYDFDDVKKYNITITPTAFGNNEYYCSYIIGFQSDTAGTFKEEMGHIIVGDDYKEYINFGIDCYNEDEILTKNLENFGIEIPSVIQKAFFLSNLREDLNDNILLNRKRKELLMNYWDVIANKGNYDSLINSLRFFEYRDKTGVYGDLVQIKEYWKRVESGFEILIGDDLENSIDDTVESQLSYMARTTYIGLYMNLVREDGTTDIELNPNTLHISEDVLRWCIEDLSMKMILLGNFFSTYFIPIHLDLIHSTIEKRIYAICNNILIGNSLSRHDFYDCNEPVSVIAHNVDEIENRNEFYLEDTHAYVYGDTLFGITTLDENAPDINDFVGVEPDVRQSDTLPEIFSRHLFNGIGKIVEFEVFIPKEKVGINDYIWKSTITYNDITQGPNYKKITYQLLNKEADVGYKFKFWLLFQNVNNHTINIEFETLERRIYTKSLNINILDSGNNSLHLFRLVRIPVTDMFNYEENQISTMFNNIYCNDMTFSSINQRYPTLWNLHDTQFINCTAANWQRSYGLNHIIEVDLDANVHGVNTSTIFSCNGQQIFIDANSVSESDTLTLQQAFPWYWWDIRKRYTTLNGGQLGDEHWIVLGIRKAFSIVNYNMLLKEFDLKTGNGRIDFSVSQFGNVIRTNYSFDNITGYEVKVKTDNAICINNVITYSDISIPNEFNTIKLTYEIYKDDKFYTVHEVVVDVQPTDILSTYGTDTYKVEVSNTGNDTVRLTDEDRFLPIFHKLYELDEPCCINKYESLAVIPEFQLSLNVNEIDIQWTFKNMTKNIELQPYSRFSPREPMFNWDLGYGYYNVCMEYKQDDENKSNTVNSSFKILR